MDTTEILVVIGGVALIGLTLWYFFGEREQVAAELFLDAVGASRARHSGYRQINTLARAVRG